MYCRMPSNNREKPTTNHLMMFLRHLANSPKIMAPFEEVRAYPEKRHELLDMQNKVGGLNWARVDAEITPFLRSAGMSNLQTHPFTSVGGTLTSYSLNEIEAIDSKEGLDRAMQGMSPGRVIDLREEKV